MPRACTARPSVVPHLNLRIVDQFCYNRKFRGGNSRSMDVSRRLA